MHQPGQGPGKVKAQPQAVCDSMRYVGSLVGLEDAIPLIFGHTLATVDNEQTGADLIRVNRHFDVCTTVPTSIGDQVPNDLSHTAGIPQGDSILSGDADRRRSAEIHGFEYLVGLSAKMYRNGYDLEVSEVSAGRYNEVVDNVGELITLVHEHRDKCLALGVGKGRLAVPQQAAVAHDCSQWCSYFV